MRSAGRLLALLLTTSLAIYVIWGPILRNFSTMLNHEQT